MHTRTYTQYLAIQYTYIFYVSVDTTLEYKESEKERERTENNSVVVDDSKPKNTSIHECGIGRTNVIFSW